MSFYSSKHVQVGTLSHHGITGIDRFLLTENNVTSRIGLRYDRKVVFNNGDRKVVCVTSKLPLATKGISHHVLHTPNGEIYICTGCLMFTETHEGEYVGLNDYELATLVLLFEGKLNSKSKSLIAVS